MTANPVAPLPAHLVQIPTPTPCVTRSMSPAERDHHRSRVGFEVEVVLQGYWVTDLAPEIKAGVMLDWVDELEDWSIDQIRWGLREWRRDNPSRKPNAGHIVAVLKQRRGIEAAAKVAAITKPAEPERKAVDDETRASQQARLQQVLSGFGQRAAQSDAGRVGA